MSSVHPYSAKLTHLLEKSGEIASYAGAQEIGVEHLLLAMLVESDTLPADALRAMGLELDLVLSRIGQLATPRLHN